MHFPSPLLTDRMLYCPMDAAVMPQIHEECNLCCVDPLQSVRATGAQEARFSTSMGIGAEEKAQQCSPFQDPVPFPDPDEAPVPRGSLDGALSCISSHVSQYVH